MIQPSAYLASEWSDWVSTVKTFSHRSFWKHRPYRSPATMSVYPPGANDGVSVIGGDSAYSWRASGAALSRWAHRSSGWLLSWTPHAAAKWRQLISTNAGCRVLRHTRLLRQYLVECDFPGLRSRVGLVADERFRHGFHPPTSPHQHLSLRFPDEIDVHEMTEQLHMQVIDQ